MTGNVLFPTFMNAMYALPLILAWLYAVAIGGWIVGRNRGAGICLMAAGIIELLSLFLGLGSAVLDNALYSSELPYEWVNVLIFGRGVLRVFVVLISHTLLLMGIYGWRQLD